MQNQHPLPSTGPSHPMNSSSHNHNGVPHLHPPLLVHPSNVIRSSTQGTSEATVSCQDPCQRWSNGQTVPELNYMKRSSTQTILPPTGPPPRPLLSQSSLPNGGPGWLRPMNGSSPNSFQSFRSPYPPQPPQPSPLLRNGLSQYPSQAAVSPLPSQRQGPPTGPANMVHYNEASSLSNQMQTQLSLKSHMETAPFSTPPPPPPLQSIPPHSRVVNLIHPHHPLSDENLLYGGESGPLQVDLPSPVLEGPNLAGKTNCDPNLLSSTLNAVPATPQLLRDSRLPLGLVLQPFRDVAHLTVIRTGNIVRCRQCRTYIHPFVTFTDSSGRSARRWRCTVCSRVNDLPEEFLYDPATKRYQSDVSSTVQRRPELTCATVEYVAPGEYALRPPQPPVLFFLFEVTKTAISSGYLNLVCREIRQHLTSHRGNDRTRIGFLTYGERLDFFQLRGTSPMQFTCPDVTSDEIFLPLPEDLLVAQCSDHLKTVVELLEELPNLYHRSQQSGNCLGTALKTALQIVGRIGGRVTVFNCTLPNMGLGALKARHVHEVSASCSTDALLRPATDWYKNLALECAGQQVGVDIFALGDHFQDLGTIADVCRFTGGALCQYSNLGASKSATATVTNQRATDSLWDLDRARLQHDFGRYLRRKFGFEAVLRLRATQGVRILAFHGSGFVRSSDLLSLANVSPDMSWAIHLDVAEPLIRDDDDAPIHQNTFITLQTALLYTSTAGERRIRVHTLCLPVVHALSPVFQHANHIAIAALLARMAVEKALTDSITSAREALVHAVVDALRTFARNEHRSPTCESLWIPFHLRHLPRLVLALLKWPALLAPHSSWDSAPDAVDRQICYMERLRNAALSNLLSMVYPGVWAVHNVPLDSLPEGANNGDTEEDAEEILCSSGVEKSEEDGESFRGDEEEEPDEDDEEYEEGSSSEESSVSSAGWPRTQHVQPDWRRGDGRTAAEDPRDPDAVKMDKAMDQWISGHGSAGFDARGLIRGLPASIAHLSRDGAYLLDCGEFLLLLLCRDLPDVYLQQLFQEGDGRNDFMFHWNAASFCTWTNGSGRPGGLLPLGEQPVNVYLRSLVRHLQMHRRWGSSLCLMRDISPLRGHLVLKRLVEDRCASEGKSDHLHNQHRKDAASPNAIQTEAATCSYTEFLQLLVRAITA